MKNNVEDNNFYSATRVWQSVIVSVMLVTLTACGEVDKSDGDVINSVPLPTDLVLTLYCADAGIKGNSCILDDPDNPYASTPISDDNKFDLNDAAPSIKSRFYLWATAQAISPTGENQYNVGVALQDLYAATGSVVAREQALKAYRSVLDNYFYSATFFEADFLPDPDIFYSFPVRKLVGEKLVTTNAEFLFDPARPTEALAEISEWGYTFDDQVTMDFTPNF